VSDRESNPSASPLRVVLATANRDKADEIAAIVLATARGRVELLERPENVPDVEETGETLEDNARLKAVALCKATGLAAVADDTGLEVTALGGAPGVHSSRFAGEGASYDDNVAKLLRELDRVGARSPELRRARFRTVALASLRDGDELVAEGTVEGEIALVPRGPNGFGYDPVFVPEGQQGPPRTFAEMDGGEKHALSHRGRAFRALVQALLRRSLAIS
jgi:XTP/dITP diphosphohydrolase